MRCRSCLLKTRDRSSGSADATYGVPIAVTFREAIEVILRHGPRRACAAPRVRYCRSAPREQRRTPRCAPAFANDPSNPEVGAQRAGWDFAELRTVRVDGILRGLDAPGLRPGSSWGRRKRYSLASPMIYPMSSIG